MTTEEFNTALNQGTTGHVLFGVSGDAERFTAWCAYRELLTVGVFSTVVNQKIIDHVHHMTQDAEKTAEFEIAGTIIVPRPYFVSDDLSAIWGSLNFHEHVIVYGCKIDPQTGKLNVFT